MKKQNNFYSIVAKDDSAEISIFDEIGFWGTTAQDFKDAWDGIKDKKSIRVLINSPGGNVFDGVAIYNLISSKTENVTVEILGLAASAASIIALAGSKLIMGESTFLMIHNPWAIAWGDQDDMRKMADSLEKVRDSLVNIYDKKSDLEKDEIIEAMSEETWYSAAEAQEAGFADEISETEDIAAKFDEEKFNKFEYKHVPSEMLGEHGAPTVRDIEHALRDAGLSRKQAKAGASKLMDQTQCDVEDDIDEKEKIANAIKILTI